MGVLTGRAAIVTGAEEGLGSDLAKELAAAGATVAVHYRPGNEEQAEGVTAAISAAGGKAIAVGAHVTVAADVRRMFDQVAEQFGAVDILVNNTDVRTFGSLGEVSEEDFRDQFYTNVLGVILAAKEAAGRFGPEGGSIINVSSTAAHIYEPNLLIYTATKSAVEAVTRVLAKELGPRNIRVNAVAPGPVETEGGRSQERLASSYVDAFISQTPLGRLGQPKEIATVVAFLASWHAQWVTGEVILASGGLRP
jgi:3-oxoacyl-[acyl-carrier protein] reductase